MGDRSSSSSSATAAAGKMAGGGEAVAGVTEEVEMDLSSDSEIDEA